MRIYKNPGVAAIPSMLLLGSQFEDVHDGSQEFESVSNLSIPESVVDMYRMSSDIAKSEIEFEES